MLCKAGDVIWSPVNTAALLLIIGSSNITLNIWIRATTNLNALKK